MIYLDSNAGAPLKSVVTEALLPFLQGPGGLLPNPSSIHSHGRIAKRALAEARESVARSIGPAVDPEQVIFTSSGSEANQLAVRSIFETQLVQGKKPHWITTPVEHDSNRQMESWLVERGGSVSYIPVNSDGVPQTDAWSDLVRPETALTSVAWVNSETGVIADLASLSQRTRARSIPLHLDAAQAWGKLDVNVDTLGAQFVTFSGHKIGALAGTGVLWLARGTPAHGVIRGKQEKGRRGGTENLLGAISVGAAARAIEPALWSARVEPLKLRLEKAISDAIPGTTINGQGASRVANTSSLSFQGVEGDSLVMALDLAGYSVSSGSACASGVLEPSHVLLAMGRSKAQAVAGVRVSLPDVVEWKDLEGFVFALEKTVTRVRSAALRNY